MNTFAIGYYLSYNDSYLERIDSLNAILFSFVNVWCEVPSLALVETSETIDAIEGKLSSSGLFGDTDLFLIVDVTGSDHRAAGVIKGLETLTRLLPGARAANLGTAADADEPVPSASLPPLETQPPLLPLAEPTLSTDGEKAGDTTAEVENATA